jgi:hypothetical protein
VVGVNDTLLRDSVPSRFVAIKGYKYVRNDLTVRGGPGVGDGGVGFRAASKFCLLKLSCVQSGNSCVHNIQETQHECCILFARTVIMVCRF